MSRLKTDDLNDAYKIQNEKTEQKINGTGQYSFNPNVHSGGSNYTKKTNTKGAGKASSPENDKKLNTTIDINEPLVETSVLIEREDMNTEVFSWGNDANGQLGLGNIHGQGGEAMEKGAGRDSYK